MSAEQNAPGPTTTSASNYPSTSVPPAPSNDVPASTTNGAQAENGTHPPNPVAGSSPSDSQVDPIGSSETNAAYYSNKMPNSNGQTRKSSALLNHNSDPSPSEQPTFADNAVSNSTPPPQQNNDHSGDFSPASNQNEGFVPTNEHPSSNTTPPSAYKAQITTTNLKLGKNVNGGDKTPTQTNATDQVEPSTSITSASAKSTPKASQSKNRTPARSRQKAGSGEPRPARPGGPNTAANASNTPTQANQSAGTKRPHPNQYTYQQKVSSAAPYPRYNNSVTVPAGSNQVHHGAQQVQYSIPASNSYSSPKIYVQSQGSSTVSSPYALHQRPGATALSQRSNVPAGSSSPQLIIQCRPDQQPYQGQASNQHFIIQTQQSSDQAPAVYQQRPGVSGRPEIQRQYIQTIPNGPPSQASVSTSQGQQAGGQPQVLHIQLHHSDLPGQQKLLIQQQPPTSAVQQQLIDKRQMSNGPQQQAIASDPQLLSALADRQGPSSSAALMNQHHLPSTAQQQLQRAKNVRTLLAQPPMAIKSDDVFDEMHPAHLPLPDSFNTILDQIHASGESPKAFYRRLKKQFKYLVYENECYQEELRNSQRHLLKLSRDKNFLLDRLLNYESAEEVSDDSDADSDATIEEKPKPKKKKVQPPRKRNPAAPSTSKKTSAKTTPKAEDENSQCSVDSALANTNSQTVDSQSANAFAATASSETKP